MCDIWRILDTLGTSKERAWMFNILLFRVGEWGEWNFTAPLVGNSVVLFGGGPESERIVLCAVLMQRAICLKGTLCHVVIVSHCPLCWWHCRDWHQAERFGEYNIHVAPICYPRPWPGLAHGAMSECSWGCDRVVFADSLKKLKSKLRS